MKFPPLPLRTFRLKNFKAVSDSGKIQFTPLTAFIGNNGSGKSSLVEGLEALYTIVELGVDTAMQEWHGIEHIHHKGKTQSFWSKPRGKFNGFRPKFSNSLSFALSGTAFRTPFSATLKINASANYDQIFIEQEKINMPDRYIGTRNSAGSIIETTHGFEVNDKFTDDKSILTDPLGSYFAKWQFVSFSPQQMGNAILQKRTGGEVRLAKDGTNIAQYLWSIYSLDQNAFQGILETLQFILPYANDLQFTLTSEIERAIYLQMSEEGKSSNKIPGWLLSTGTLRLVALLALLRHPKPPSLLVIEEIENGLDPRTISLIVDEIRNAVESGQTQVIITTHSPYLLDLLDLSQIILVEREAGVPVFSRPANNESLKEWSKKFSPGKLYTMDKLGKANS